MYTFSLAIKFISDGINDVNFVNVTVLIFLYIVVPRTGPIFNKIVKVNSGV